VSCRQVAGRDGGGTGCKGSERFERSRRSLFILRSFVACLIRTELL